MVQLSLLLYAMEICLNDHSYTYTGSPLTQVMMLKFHTLAVLYQYSVLVFIRHRFLALKSIGDKVMVY